MSERLVESVFPVSDFAVEHLGGDGQDVEDGVVEQIPGVRDARVRRGEGVALGVGLWQLALRRVRHAASVVDGGRRAAVQVGVIGKRFGDQVVPPAEPYEHVYPQGHECLQPVRHRR